MDWFKVHKDYDKLEEPSRFLIFLFIMSPFYYGLYLLTHEAIIPGLIGMLFVVLIAFYRVIYFAKFQGEDEE